MRRTQRRRRSASPQGRGVWMLLAMLGAVLLLMRQLEQQAAVDFLGRVFANQPSGDWPASAEALPTNTGRSEGAWAQVEDNAMFLPADRPAWDEALQYVRETPHTDLVKQSLGEVAYAQLIAQPDVYRGEAVRIRGHVVREATKVPTAELSGVAQYHELIIAPVGGGEMPFTCYCLDLPNEFPRGDKGKEPVVVDGVFFKNRSYLHDRGMGLTPVIVARTVQWQPLAATKARRALANDHRDLQVGVVGAATVAILFAVWVKRQTRRPRRRAEAAPDFALVEAEA